jgi:Coenzyme PQQ synthesis protein D (PqqD)
MIPVAGTPSGCSTEAPMKSDAGSPGVSPGRLDLGNAFTKGAPMSFPTRYRVNHPKVVNETIEGEVVILNLDRGHYYSLTSVGMEVWTMLERRDSVDEIMATLLRQYEVPAHHLEQAIAKLIDEFQQEELVVPTTGRPEDPSLGAAEAIPVSAPASTAVATQKRPFEPPVLRKYTDMEDLLLLDPIHEADETGWPAPRSDSGQIPG